MDNKHIASSTYMAISPIIGNKHVMVLIDYRPYSTISIFDKEEY
jgi:hypothetical protein